VQILRQDAERLGWRVNFSIYDELDRSQLIKETGRELGFSQDTLDAYKIGSLFSGVKTGRRGWTGNDEYRRLYEEYQAGLKLHNAVDFDDLIVLPIALFREHPDVLDRYRARYRYLLVDEFQDTSEQQYELMRLLADENVAVVGDDDQSIYSWRGASYENIRRFERDFPAAREIRLEQNYRSTKTILDAANGVISHNTKRKDKELWSGKGSGKPIEVYFPENEAAEADFIAETILELRVSERRRYEDFGVLVRANTQFRTIEGAFRGANIPYAVSGGTSSFERREIRDILSYLHVCANCDDDVNLLRIINTPRRGIGRKALEELNAAANERQCSLWDALQSLAAAPSPQAQLSFGGMSEAADGNEERSAFDGFRSLIAAQRAALLVGKGLSNKVRALVEEIGYFGFLAGEYQMNEKAARVENVEWLLGEIGRWEHKPDTPDPSLFAWLSRIALLSRDDLSDDGNGGKANLMTIHASKGLEFPVVFIAGAEDGTIPHARALEENPDSVEEERRLFYVAITRARDKLFISSRKTRGKGKTARLCEPSRFLAEIPAELVGYEPEPEPDEATLTTLFANMKRNISG
jgi:DNA helicase-2/ATP-dependent DNA helicase PcrA